MELQKMDMIVKAIKVDRRKFPSDAQHAISLGINKAVYSQICKGNYSKKLTEQSWISIAHRLNVRIHAFEKWQIVKTPTLIYLTTQMETCMLNSTTAIFCDRSGIGKTEAARYFAAANKNAVYIPCGEYSTKYALMRELARCFGMDTAGKKYRELVEELALYIKTLQQPFIAFDEAADLHPEAFLALKTFYNMVEGYCGMMLLGADGLKTRINRNMTVGSVGFAELFDRFGSEFMSCTPKDKSAFLAYNRVQADLIVRANVPDAEAEQVEKLVNDNALTLRRLGKSIQEIHKSKKASRA